MRMSSYILQNSEIQCAPSYTQQLIVAQTIVQYEDKALIIQASIHCRVGLTGVALANLADPIWTLMFQGPCASSIGARRRDR